MVVGGSRAWWLLACTFSSAAAGWARPCAAQDVLERAAPAIRVFADKDGLPQNTVGSETFDSDGRLWVGTQEGLAVYDGRAFRRVRLPEGARSEWVTGLAELPDAQVAVGTHADGVWIVDGPRFAHVDATNGLPDDGVDAVAATPEGDLWVGTRRGLARRIGGVWSVVSAKDAPLTDGPVAAIAVDPGPAKSVWVGSPLGISVYAGGVWRGYPAGAHGLPTAHPIYVSVEPDGSGPGRPWVSTRGGGLLTLEGDEWRAIEGLPCDDVGPVAAGQGSLWIGTVCGGLARRQGGRVSVMDAHSSALPSDLVRSVKIGRASQGPPALWVGTETGGVARVSIGGWRSLTPKNSALQTAVYAFGWSRDADDGGDVTWVGTEAGLFRYDGRAWSEVTLPGLARNETYVNAILSARGTADRGLWVATFGGVARLRDGAWQVFRQAEGLPAAIVLTLHEVTGSDGEPELLAGLRSGFVRFDGQRWVPVTGEGAPTNEEVTSVVETRGPSGHPVLWVATVASGLFRRESGVWTHFTTTSSPLPCDEVLQVQRVRFPGDTERLFVSTGEAGLAWIDPTAASPRWSFLSTKTTPALPDQVVYGVQQDERGRVYAYTNHGIARLTLRPERNGETFDVTVFTTEDGLPSNECNSGGSAIDPRGRVWAGTTGGAAVLDASLDVEDKEAKKLLLVSTSLFATPFDLRAHPELSYAQDTLTFETSLVSLHRPADTRYRTQLVGLEDEPSPWSPDSKVRYTSLPAGAYELRVWGKDYAGNVSGPLTVPFRVRPAPWKTWWAFGMYLAAAAGLGVLGVRARTAALHRHADELSARVAERTAELASRNEELARKNQELDRKNAELVLSHERADRIFSAFTDVLPGSVLDDKYRVEARIGAGGFATVFRAKQIALDRAVAVKIFRPSPGNDSAMALERFRREGMSACRVMHPNAIQVFDAAISSDGIPYIVMELLEGRALSAEIRMSGGMPLRRALGIVIPVCEALAAAHEAGVVHRDIKPDNVFLHQSTDGEVVKLLDFGIAKLQEVDEDGESANTASTTFVGTPKYMAPERLSHSAYGEKSDVYSVGVILYEMVLGATPWPAANDLFTIIAQIVAGQVVPMSERGIPAVLSELVGRVLTHEPHERPTAAELARQLAEIRRSLSEVELDRVYGAPLAAPEDVPMTTEMSKVGPVSGIRGEVSAPVSERMERGRG